MKPWAGVQSQLGSRSRAALSNVSSVSCVLCLLEVAIGTVHVVLGDVQPSRASPNQ